MEERPSPREAGDAPTSKAEAADLDEKIKRMEMRPPAVPALGLLVKNAALLPTGIARVKQQSQPSTSSGSATGNPRNKTALAPGHSLMDWIRLGSSGVDLTGVGGQPIRVTPAELARHDKEDDAWIAIRGIVFNVSRYIKFHPGGVSELMRGVGRDATKLFEEVHSWVNYQSILQKCVVGRLERGVSAELYFESDKDKHEKSAESPSDTEAVPDPPTVKMDWRQTTNTVTFSYTAPKDNPVSECQIRRLGGSHFTLRMCLEKDADIVTHNVKLAADVDWPPNWQRNAEPPEMMLQFKKTTRSVWKSYGSFQVSGEKVNKLKRTYNEYEVIENTPICNVVHLLVLRAENYIQLVPPGRHVEVKIDVLGQEVSRLYTPVPWCLHSEDRPVSGREEDSLCLMVKRYEDGAVTPRLTALTSGQRLAVSGSLGHFQAQAFDHFQKIHLLAAGSGLTVMLAILKRNLARRTPSSANLVSFNRDEDSIFYARELARAEEARKVTVTHVLSAAKSTWEGRTGTATEDLLKDLIGKHQQNACVFTCGPPGFMELARKSLQNLGWMPPQLFEFDG